MSGDRNHRELAVLPDDVLIDILSRVPYISVCRFKIVSKSWLALCSSPDVRKLSPQSLAGFFCYARGRRFLSTYGNRTRGPADPSFPFLRAFQGFAIVDSCNGLLLCGCWTHDSHEYVVCNPATEKWLVLPHIPQRSSAPHCTVRMHLGFEPAVSPHFTVFVFSSFPHTSSQQPGGLEVGIYSSEAGEWTFRQSEWGTIDVATHSYSQSVFLNGTLRMTTFNSRMHQLDKDGHTWRQSQMPDMMGYGDWSIGYSQGCCYATNIKNHHRASSQLTVLVLEDCESDRWVMKHTASLGEVFGRQEVSYYVLAFCPDQNKIFLTAEMGKQSDLMSYDMDNGKGHVVCSLEEYFLLEPYTPCFAEWLSDGHSQI